MLDSLKNALDHVVLLWTAGELVIMLATAIALVVAAKLYFNGKLKFLNEPFVVEEIEIIEE